MLHYPQATFQFPVPNFIRSICQNIRGIDTAHSISHNRQYVMRLLKSIIASGVTKKSPGEGSYLPDSLVGCFTIKVHELQRSWTFPASPFQRRMQHCRMMKEIAAANRLVPRVAAMTSAGGVLHAKVD